MLYDYFFNLKRNPKNSITIEKINTSKAPSEEKPVIIQARKKNAPIPISTPPKE